MPEILVHFFKEADGTVPLIEWLDGRAEKVQDKCQERLERLEAFGHELRRPLADFLRDGIYELRVRVGTVQHRMFYFFAGQGAAVVCHGLSGKGGKVPEVEINRALERKARFERNPKVHTFQRTHP